MAAVPILAHVVLYFSVSAPFPAVIGAGIGGTAAAYYLREEFGPVVKIDVFESGIVGGRLATVKMGDYEYETGGSVIHPLNLHMKQFIEKIGNLSTTTAYLTDHQINMCFLNLMPRCQQVFPRGKTSPLKWRSSMGKS